MDLAAFSDPLARLGYPPCPGHVMVSNPAWVKGRSSGRAQIELACARAGEDDLLWLATWPMPRPSGDRPCSPLPPATWRACLADRPDLLAEMARAAVAFTPLTLFGRLEQDPEGLDLKRGGLFPWCTVCGCSPWRRACWKPRPWGAHRRPWWPRAPQQRLRRQSGVEAFRLFMRLRLRSQLQEGDGRAHVAGLGHTERDLLRHALHQVRSSSSGSPCTFV